MGCCSLTTGWPHESQYVASIDTFGGYVEKHGELRQMRLAPHSRWMNLVAQAGCVICKRFEDLDSPAQVHHVAEGSGVRSDYMTVGLCPEHHLGATGLHGMGPRAFLRFYRPPGESEYGLLAWVNEDMTKKGLI